MSFLDFNIYFELDIVKILKLYIIPLCTHLETPHLYHFFPVSIHYLHGIQCLLHYM